MNRGPRAGEIYIEFRPMGKQVQVTAIDAATGRRSLDVRPVFCFAK